MRHVLLATLAALLLAGCGTEETTPGDASPPVEWNGPPELRPLGGELEVGGFRAYAESVDADWERDPELLARELLRVESGTVTVADGEAVLLRDSLEDDSVRAERWVLELERDGDHWSLQSARWGQRCHEGRGHQDFRAELCV